MSRPAGLLLASIFVAAPICSAASPNIDRLAATGMKFTAAYASPNCAPTRASHFPAYLEANRDGSTWRTTPAAAVRAGRYKLIEFFETGALELYDLEEDISESQNLVSSHSELAAELHKKLEHWQERVDAPMPTVK